MTRTAIQVPAGWYPDPIGQTVGGMSTHRRWWDGDQWTDHVEALLHATAPQSPVITTGAVSSARAFAEAQAGHAGSVASPSSYTATTSAPVTLTPRDSTRAARIMSLHSVSADSAPYADSLPSPAMRTRPSRRHAAAPRRPRVYTASVWLMATMPLTQAMLVYYVFTNLPPESSAWTRALTLVFPFILCAALAGQDARLMALAGHLRTAPWVSALVVPPVYLAVRSARIGRSTGAIAWPVYVWLLCQAIVFAVWWMVDPEGVTALVDLVV